MTVCGFVRKRLALVIIVFERPYECMCVCMCVAFQARVAEDRAVAAARAMSPKVCVAVLPRSCDVM